MAKKQKIRAVKGWMVLNYFGSLSHAVVGGPKYDKVFRYKQDAIKDNPLLAQQSGLASVTITPRKKGGR